MRYKGTGSFEVRDTASPGSRWIDTTSLPWQAVGDTGFMAKFLLSARGDGVHVGITRFPAGGEIPVHRHDGDEFVYVLDGTLHDDGGRLSPGWASYRPPGCTHAVTSNDGAIVFVVATGRSEPAAVHPAGPHSRPILPNRLAEKGALDSGVTTAVLWRDRPIQGNVARHIDLVQLDVGRSLSLPSQGSERVCLIIAGSVEHGGDAMGPGWFCHMAPGESTTVVATHPTTVLFAEWTPAQR